MKSFCHILSSRSHRTLPGMVLALCLGAPASAAPPAGEAGCKVWNVQLGSSVFAIPYTPDLLRSPRIHVDEMSPEKTIFLYHAPCDDIPIKIRSIAFSFSMPHRQRGEVPGSVQLLYPALSPDDSTLRTNYHQVDPSLIKTRCSDGLDTGIARAESPIRRIFGCRKDSGRLLIWECKFPPGRDDGLCMAIDNYGPVTVSYDWNRKHASHERAPQLDDAVIDFLNSMIVSGEKLPR